ncbi:copper transporter 5.1 [Rutidosis leptorrhynchoides]|uniref:copper transporter 5.1 n=1 Tax=Rutidosis leptorrhynchoides TaxID=125765 RepID=UPI003A997113
MMHMTFYWSNNVTLLIDSWHTDSWFTYFLTLIVCFAVSIFYQFMEDLRIRFKIKSTSKASVENDPLLYTKFSSSRRQARVVGCVLFGLNSGINYFMMLAVMSFNGGVFVSIVVGLAVGYWWFRSTTDDDDQQIMLLDESCACC